MEFYFIEIVLVLFVFQYNLLLSLDILGNFPCQNLQIYLPCNGYS